MLPFQTKLITIIHKTIKNELLMGLRVPRKYKVIKIL